MGVFLRVEIEGEANDIELVSANPKRPLRVAVGRPGRRGSVWRIWANTDKADVYVAVRNVAGVQKISLHESGQWRYAWVNAEQALQYSGADERLIDQWTRPEAADHGHTTGISIWVPHGCLSDIPDDDQGTDQVIYLPEPPPGLMTGIHVTVSIPDRNVVPFQGAVPVAGIVLPPNDRHPFDPGSVEGAVVVCSMQPIGEELLSTFATALPLVDEEMKRRGTSIVEQAAATVAPRLALWAVDENGGRHFYDLAADRVTVTDGVVSLDLG